MPHIQISFSHLLSILLLLLLLLILSFLPFFLESWFISTPLEMGELTHWTQFLDLLGLFITWFYVLHSKEAMVRFWFSCYQCQIRSLKELGILLPHCGITGVKGCGDLWGGLGESQKIYLMWYIAGPSSKEAAYLSMNEFWV